MHESIIKTKYTTDRRGRRLLHSYNRARLRWTPHLPLPRGTNRSRCARSRPSTSAVGRRARRRPVAVVKESGVAIMPLTRRPAYDPAWRRRVPAEIQNAHAATFSEIAAILAYFFCGHIRYVSDRCVNFGCPRLECSGVEKAYGFFPDGKWTDVHTTNFVKFCERHGLRVKHRDARRVIEAHATERGLRKPLPFSFQGKNNARHG